MTVLKAVHRILFAGDVAVEPNVLFEASESDTSFFLKHGAAIEASEAEQALYQAKKAAAPAPKSQKTSAPAPKVVVPPSDTGSEKTE